MALLSSDARFVLRDGVLHIVQSKRGEEVDGVELKNIYSADVMYRPDSLVQAKLIVEVVPDASAKE